MKRETKLLGIPVVSGWGMGNAYFVGRAVQQTATISISRQDLGSEIMRFNEIRERAKKEYRQHHADISAASNVKVDASILNIYEHILDDPAFIGQVVETVSTKLYDVETSIRLVSNDFIKRFDSAGTSYFKERSGDMVEVCEKLISLLYEDEGRTKKFMDPVVLIVLRTFTPSDILSYDKTKIQAVVTASGGKTSHAAILARSYNIPVVSGIRNLSESIAPGDQLLVDAEKGIVYVRPPTATTGRYRRQAGSEAAFEVYKKKWQRPVYTRDGVKIDVVANISLAEDVDAAIEYGADGIGLVRTEYLVANRKEMPDLKAQISYYESIFKKAPKKHSVIRLMDIGGDKVPQFFDMPLEFNPFMGWRAVRIFLERQDYFELQVEAIMKAGLSYDYSIMAPMVTTLQEWIDAKTVIAGVASRLGMPMPKTGILFEVPLAILEINMFLKEIDFASIGTNDLIQYLSAADRNNTKVNYLYNPIEPAFLRIMRNAIKTATDSGMPLSVCGEMAGNPLHTVLLVGMGLRRFSVIPRTIPIIKELVSHLSYVEAAESISHIDAIDSTQDMSRWLKNLNKRLLGDVLSKLPVAVEV
ncbi:MAG: phosphoenolpyruvate--protein phosphotransferase [Chitinispirillaceae bacterium]|nr:phosphoenolpyruvate--protein phosphotransferase [Chitinispirillaceae bacterium]